MRRTAHRPAPPRGFTLVEAMIASAIVAIAALATISLVRFCQISNTIEQERARAHQIVSQQMEEVRLQLFTMVTAGQTVTIWDNGTPIDTTDDTLGTLVIRMLDPESGAWLTAAPVPARRVQVEVTLSWNPRGSLSGETMSETVMTYLAP